VIEDEDACEFFLLFTIDELNCEPTTNAAALSTMAVVLIFFFTALVVLYTTRMVQLRQERDNGAAINRTSEIIGLSFRRTTCAIKSLPRKIQGDLKQTQTV
jgi:chromatin segregation and condensation protein Rec8/ScpA/Scc1 (kleisin family)